MNVIAIYNRVNGGTEWFYFSISYEHSKLRLRLVGYYHSIGVHREVWVSTNFPLHALAHGAQLLPRRPTVSKDVQAKLRERIANSVTFEFPRV
jgi:hypothetical protein